MRIDGHTEPQLVPKLLLKVSVRQLNNNLVSKVDNGGKQLRNEDGNIIISDSTLHSQLSPQFKNVIKIQGNVWLQTFYICQKYTFIITFMARSFF